MNSTHLQSAVNSELINNSGGLISLKLQNHLYGCFLIMEDIAQTVVDLSGTHAITPNFSIDLDSQFSEIGIRYGFVMDTALTYTEFKQEYKNAWIQCFKGLDVVREISEVDSIEDSLIKLIQAHTSKEYAFFLHALDTGSLSPVWIDKALQLIRTPSDSNLQDEPTLNTAISKAEIEKPRNSLVHKKPHRLSITRRSNNKITSDVKRKNLSKTRRNHL
jgi:hypothetical protein